MLQFYYQCSEKYKLNTCKWFGPENKDDQNAKKIADFILEGKGEYNFLNTDLELNNPNITDKN
jgi:hypothetical protein